MGTGNSEGNKGHITVQPSRADALYFILSVQGGGKVTVMKVPKGTFSLPVGLDINYTITPAQHLAMEKLIPTPNALMNYFKQLIIEQLPSGLYALLKPYIDWVFLVGKKYILKELIDRLKLPPPPIVCPTGQHWDFNLEQCVPNDPPPHTCPAGQHWDSAQGKCVPDVLPPPPPTCPPGQHWDPDLLKCVPNVTPPPPGDGTDSARNQILKRLADCVCTIEQTLGAAAADDCLCRIAAAVEAIASSGTLDLAPLTAQLKRIADAANDSGNVNAFIKQLAKDGYISGADAQLLTS